MAAELICAATHVSRSPVSEQVTISGEDLCQTQEYLRLRDSYFSTAAGSLPHFRIKDFILPVIKVQA